MYHTPVLLNEAVEALNVKKNGIYVDATLGGGGHSREILKLLEDGDCNSGAGHLYAFDQDEDAINYVAKSELANKKNFTFIDKNFTFLPNYLALYGVAKIDGLLADLGVSSHQFDTAERGFSIRENALLDMRMDRRQTLTASDIVNNYQEARLADVFYLYGELPQARKIASLIVNARSGNYDNGSSSDGSSSSNGTIRDTKTLIEILQNIAPKGKENKFFAQVFQALRIEVNGELDALKKLLAEATKALAPEGRLVVLSYHSLEDRIVKHWLKTGNAEGKLEKDFYGNPLSPLKPLHSKAIIPSEEEIQRNPRARSAKMRVAQKI
ncbi:MAG: 16S rRNA (cytosine(1402)-N(4))-methyltransferase RsmH [Bacteroidales bacterium]|jgi:16S rRNA (cytosine1402-N4)-methyltransferase|nr:16S rRNA (cytosine(1402)-N(4))-methyltransferase RsmH [Bacteroidales bacterium]